MTEAYPLQWPQGKPRTRHPTRSRFGERSLDQVTRILLAEIRRLNGEKVVVSTNTRLRQDGLPYSKQAQPSDTGAAVYFMYNEHQMCFACDRWDRIQDNLYAIAMTIEALRGIERWGSGDMVQQAFSGFTALPDYTKTDCWSILGITPTKSVLSITAAYREQVRYCHPDTGGSAHKFQQLNDAKEAALKYAAA